MSAYLVIAYRWGYLNGHQYVVYVGTDEMKAFACAQAENADRGGKYGCAAYRFTDEGAEQKQERIAYHPSSYGEKEPYHNWRIDMLESLGHVFHDFALGTVYLPEKDKDGNPTTVLKPHKVDPPDWAVERMQSKERFCEAMMRAQEERATKLSTKTVSS